LTEPVFNNAEEAAQALAAAVNEDAGGQVAPEPTVTPSPDENQPVTPDATGTPEVESFTDYDAAIEALPDEARLIVEQRLNQMQGDYTRKTQEVAEQRREAEQAIQFVRELETNPNFAAQVQNEIATALEASGWTPQEASEEASRQVDEAVSGDAGELDSDDPLVRELNELKAWREEQEARQLELEMENEFDRMDVAVRKANPDFSEDDMTHVYALSYATGGDLEAAADAYKEETKRILSSYLERKQSVEAPAHVSTGGSSQQPPEEFEGLFDPRLEAAANRMLGEALGQ
jgi:hypothetical protein